MGAWPACLLAELLVEGTICILAFYYIGYTLSGQIIMRSEIIIIWPHSVCYQGIFCRYITNVGSSILGNRQGEGLSFILGKHLWGCIAWGLGSGVREE